MNILVFAEVRDGKLKKSSLETLSEAVRLSKKLGSKVGVALVGEGSRRTRRRWGSTAPRRSSRSTTHA
jgi:electron transfer flavoprotein alpha subunit